MAGLKSEEINVKSVELVDWTQSLWENRNFSVIYLLPHCFCTVSMIYQQEKLKLMARNPYYEAVQVYPHGLEQHPHF